MSRPESPFSSGDPQPAYRPSQPPGYWGPAGFGPPPGHSPPPGYAGQGGSGHGVAPTEGWYAPPEPPGPAPGVWFAPHGERLIAYIFDGLILMALMVGGVLLLIGAGILGDRGSVALGIFLFLLLVAVVSVGYFPFFWARGGQTPGMKAFNLYVVRDRDGGPVSAGQALLRLVGYWVNGLVFYIGFIWVFVDARRRGWHDLIAGTLVVKR